MGERLCILIETFLIRFHRIKPIPAMGMDIDKPRKDPVCVYVQVCLKASIWIDGPDHAILKFNLGWHEVIYYPDFFALNDHSLFFLIPFSKKKAGKPTLSSLKCIL